MCVSVFLDVWVLVRACARVRVFFQSVNSLSTVGQGLYMHGCCETSEAESTLLKAQDLPDIARRHLGAVTAA
jgi:hypothetical protein